MKRYNVGTDAKENRALPYFFLPAASACREGGRAQKDRISDLRYEAKSRSVLIHTHSLLGGTPDLLGTVLSLLAQLARWLLDLLGKAELWVRRATKDVAWSA